MIQLQVRTERWPIAGAFTISRGSKTAADVVVAELTESGITGRGECIPYPRYGETIESVTSELHAMQAHLADGLDRLGVQARMPAGAARNALDCAFWDLEAKRRHVPAFRTAGLDRLDPLITAFTVSLGDPEAMASAAAAAAHRKILKIKLGAPGDPERIAGVRRAAPSAELIVDANEGWTAENLSENIDACAAAGVTLIEQPLPAGADDVLAERRWRVRLCADESAHDRACLPALRGRYDALNIKLDKTGGLTEALALQAEARRSGLAVMVGCMICTSLSIAPALILAQGAQVVDLDGAQLLARDHPDGVRYDGSIVRPPAAGFWGD